MKQTYMISGKHSIESDEEGNFAPFALNLALAHVAGWEINNMTPLDDVLITKTGPDGSEVTRFIPQNNDSLTIYKHANTYGVEPFIPLQSPEFAQELMTYFPCVITPIVSHGGALRGLWKVESLSGWEAANIATAGLRYGTNEYVDTLSASLPEAIGLNVLSRAGIGKQAFFYYPDMSHEEGELVYMGQRSIEMVKMDPDFLLHIVAAPELDKYAMIPAPEDVIAEARIAADATALIQKNELKKRQEEREAKEAEENEAAAAEAPAPESNESVAAPDAEKQKKPRKVKSEKA